MIIRIKTIGTIAAIAIAFTNIPANAYLKSASSIQPGEYCNTSCTYKGCPVLEKTNATVLDFDLLQNLPNCTDANTQSHDSTTLCWLNITPGNYMLCSGSDENACTLFYLDHPYTTNWTTYNNSRYSVIRQTTSQNNSSYYYCQATTTTEYGCDTNYYATSGIGTSNINCVKCLNSEEGGAGTGEIGQSNIGTTSITQCFIERGNEICNSTGCFDYMQDCYYKN